MMNSDMINLKFMVSCWIMNENTSHRLVLEMIVLENVTSSSTSIVNSLKWCLIIQSIVAIIMPLLHD